MYKMSECIDLSNGRPGLIIPLFRMERTNVPFVQEMDNYLKIVSFVPYYGADEYSIISVAEPIMADIDELGIVAFIKPDGNVFAGRFPAVYKYTIDSKENLVNFPLLNAQLLRLIGADTAVQYDAFRLASDTYFSSKEQREAWVRAQM